MPDPAIFSPSIELTTGEGAHGVAAGDINGDGINDLVVVNAGTDSVSVLLGLGDGTFQSAVSYGVVGDQPKSVVLVDFNGDGRLDLLTANQGDAGTVSILYNNPNSVGTFLPAVVLGGAPGSHEAVAADVDLDGDLDIAVAGWGGSIIRVLLNSGSGVFSSSNSFVYNVGNAPHSLQFGDFNNDSRPDLAVANTNSGSVTILLNGVAGAAAGTFTATATYSVGGGPHSIRLADVDGDGNLDLATANQNSNSISLLLGQGDGTFISTAPLGTGPVPKGIAIADVNGDGLLDLLTANTAGNYPDNSNNSGGDTISIHYGEGEGVFSAPVTVTTGNTPFAVIAADFNADGLLDLATANWFGSGGSGSAGVLINASVPPVNDGTGPAATLTASNITVAPGGAYTFTVRYVDPSGVDVTTIDSTDVQVTGPNDDIRLATLVSITPSSNANAVTATYRITAPGGSWNTDDNGVYAVSLLAGTVIDSFGNTTAAAALGSFAVNIADASTVYLSDLTPTASINGWGPYERDRSNGENGAADGGVLTLNGTTYVKGLGVHSTSSLTYALGGSYSRFQSDIGVDDGVGSRGSVVFRVLADGVEIFRSGTLTGASATQSLDLNVDGVQTLVLVVDNADGSANSDHGNWADAKLISAPIVPPVNDGTGPAATLTASNITVAPGGAYTFTVRYVDPSGVDVTTIDSTDVQVTGPNDDIRLATLVSITPSSNANAVTATYRITAPGGSWNTDDNGVYAVSLLAGTVIDSFGNTTAAAALGSFAVNIADASTVYLSDLTPTASINGWGPYERDRSNGENGAADGGVLTLNGTTYVKGLGVHSTSSLTYALGGSYSRFQSDIGVDDGVGSRGSVVFRVLADGVEIFRSGTLTGASATQSLDLNVDGVQTLVLVVDNADGSANSDHGNWADAKLISAPIVPPVNDGTGPAATLTASNITVAPGGAYTFTVRYVDPSGVDVTTIDSTDVQVTGPNDDIRLATLVSITPSSNANAVTATYRITAPGGSWNTDDNGVYAVSLLAGTVIDSFGNTTAAAALGSFAVNIADASTVYLSDLTPTASINGWGPYERDRSNGENGAADGGVLTLNGTTYVKGLGVHSTSSLTYALGGSYSRFQSDIGVDDGVGSRGSVVFRVLADGVEIFRSGTLTGASATQSLDLNVDGVQTLVLVVDNADGSANSDHGNWADAKLISAPIVPPVNDGTGPAATLTASNITVAPGGAYTFTVRYVDPSGVDVTTIDSTDVQVTGPNDDIRLATLVSITPSSNANAVTATYRITAPGGSWNTDDNGVYAVSLLAGTVIDSFGNTTAAAALGSFAVNIADASTVYLSDLTPTASINGWGPYERDRSNGENGAADGGVLTLNGTTYVKGLGVHSTSSLTYALGGSYSRFQSDIGVDDGVGSRGSVVFRVLADGVEIFRSGTLTGASATQSLDLNVDGVQTLVLVVDNADGSANSDHGNWADAKLIRGDVFRLSSNELNIISEGDGEAVLHAERVGSNLGAMTLQFTTNQIVGSATPGVDFTPPNTVGFNTGQITFAAGEAEQPFSVPVVDDNEVEDNELFAVGIQNPSTGSLGAPRTARILIVDDDGESRISLVETNLSVSERDGTATLTLVRSGDRSDAATVQLLTSNGTGTAGSDYGTVSRTVSFAAGSFVQTVEIPILDDFETESSESFQVQISDPVGASLHGNTEATVTILDNEFELGNLQRQSFVSGLNRPTTFDWLPDGSTMLVAEKSGLVQVVVNGAVRSTPLIDLSTIVNDTGDRGLLGLAVHPDFGGANPYVYVAYTYDPPETAGFTGNAGADGNGNRPARVEKLTVDPATLAVTGREVILGKNSRWEYTSGPNIDSTGSPEVLPSGIVNGTTITADNAQTDQGYQDNIPSLAGIQNLNIRDYLAGDSTSHTIGDVEFGPDGYLYVTVGDGTSYNFQDNRTVRVQDIANLSGKTLRLDPLTGQGVATNPFFNGDPDSNQSKVFYSGLRNPYRFSFDPVSGLPMIGDVGWNTWEEINTGAPGTNFGWPYFEGPDQAGGYSSLASAQAFYNNGNVNPGSPNSQPAGAPIHVFNHSAPDNFAAIMVGDFFNTNTFVYGDLLSGRLFAATLDANRQLSSITGFDTGASYMVDLKLGPDGSLYGSSLYNSQFGPGEIVRWQVA
ncbi:NPCBM/NEW2 domain-containing protein [Cyanobium sp. ULC084]